MMVWEATHFRTPAAWYKFHPSHRLKTVTFERPTWSNVGMARVGKRDLRDLPPGLRCYSYPITWSTMSSMRQKGLHLNILESTMNINELYSYSFSIFFHQFFNVFHHLLNRNRPTSWIQIRLRSPIPQAVPPPRQRERHQRQRPAWICWVAWWIFFVCSGFWLKRRCMKIDIWYSFMMISIFNSPRGSEVDYLSCCIILYGNWVEAGNFHSSWSSWWHLLHHFSKIAKFSSPSSCFPFPPPRLADLNYNPNIKMPIEILPQEMVDHYILCQMGFIVIVHVHIFVCFHTHLRRLWTLQACNTSPGSWRLWSQCQQTEPLGPYNP